MRNLIILGIIAAVTYNACHKSGAQTGVKVLNPGAYVTVYGRDSCSCTTKMIEDLKKSKIEYRLLDIDDREIADECHKKMTRAGISTQSYDLPVVVVNGRVYIRPDISEVEEEYFSAAKK